MIYRAIGVMSGSSLDGLDLAFAEFQENAGKWSYEIKQADCYEYAGDWVDKLKQATSLSAKDYQLLHSEYGHYLGRQVNRFIEQNNLQYQVALVSSHGHTTFHVPAKKMTAQLGDGAAIASETALPVVTDLRALDVAFGGQGAPIVPIGEKLLLGDYDYFLNLGGIANISVNTDSYLAFDVCPANRVLNMLANDAGKEFDNGGEMANAGTADQRLLQQLNSLDYYNQPAPKSLANEFGTETVYPLIRDAGCSIGDGLRTYVEHVVAQIRKAIEKENPRLTESVGQGKPKIESRKLLVTGGGAFNTFMVKKIEEELSSLDIEVVIPRDELVKFKEALIMAFIGVLRWRQEYNVLSSVTGAARDSIGGALWIGQEA
jgi:anhydro-N-acetylmuramic acid kinase